MGEKQKITGWSIVESHCCWVLLPSHSVVPGLRGSLTLLASSVWSLTVSSVGGRGFPCSAGCPIITGLFLSYRAKALRLASEILSDLEIESVQHP